jgi:hypothetical protein
MKGWWAMSAIQAAPRLPGVRAGTSLVVNAILFGALFLLAWVPLIALFTADASRSGGHLPWPVAQWALTTPAGALALLVVSVLIIAPSYIVGQLRILPQRRLARAIDVTDVLPRIWPARPPVRTGETRADRWLGRTRRARIASLALLAVAALIILLLVAGFIALATSSFLYIDKVECGARGCPPTYPLFPIVLASEIVMLALSSLAQYQWLRRAEARSGVWLRYRGWFTTSALSYIRRPGVTPEAAAAALARFAPAEAMPVARVVATAVLAAIPLILVLAVGYFLQFRLPTQWVPG